MLIADKCITPAILSFDFTIETVTEARKNYYYSGEFRPGRRDEGDTMTAIAHYPARGLALS